MTSEKGHSEKVCDLGTMKMVTIQMLVENQMDLKSICDRDIIKLFGKALRAFTTTSVSKVSGGTRLIAGSNGNNVKDWVIRSQTSKPVKQGHEEGPTTTRL